MDRYKYRGAMLGLAAGDALGTAVEFMPPGTFPPVTDLLGGGQFNLRPGEWTDDTSMALCLAESLVEQEGFDPADQMRRYLRWYREGYMSVTGICFDIGNTVGAALRRFERTKEPYSGAIDPRAAGNGSLMRLAPVVLLFAPSPAAAISRAADSSRTTHGAREAVDACRLLAALMVGALQGLAKEEILAPGYAPVAGLWEREELAPKIAAISQGSYLRRQPPAIRGTGYAVDCLEAALWAFARGADFREGALLAVNLGEDADTTGAVYGQLAGAYYGEEGIPAEWRQKLAWHDRIANLADRLHRLAVNRRG